jgi:hypothetical protein
MAGILLLVGGSLPVPDSFGADFRRRAVCAKLPRMNVASDTLYEEDFYAWTQQQADLLRRLPAECPYTLVQIIGSGDEDWFPEPGTDRHSGARATPAPRNP